MINRMLSSLKEYVFLRVFLWCLIGVHWASVSVYSASFERDLNGLKFERIDTSDSLSSIAVTSIVQDSKGFIWLGSRGGVARYDGYEFVEYANDASNDGSLRHRYVNTLFMSSEGTLWVGLERGVARYDERKDRFKNFVMGDGDPSVFSIAQSRTGDIIAGTVTGNVYRYIENQERFELVLELGSTEIKSMLVDNEGDIWLGARDSIIKLGTDYVLKERMSFPFEYDRSSNTFVSAMVQTPDGRIVVGFNGFGSWYLDSKSRSFSKIPSQSSTEDIVKSLYIDDNNHLFIGTTAGLVIVDVEGEHIIRYYNSEYYPSSIQPGTVYGICIDKQGNLWVGTSRGGLSAVYDGRNFEIIRYSLFDVNALSKEKVTSIYEDQMGRLWVGYHNDGLDLVDRKSGVKRFVNPYSGRSDRLGRGSIWDIEKDNTGRFLIAASSAGLQAFDPDTEEVTKFVPDESNPYAIHGSDVRSLLKDADGNLWIGLHGRGVDYFDISKGQFYSVPGLEQAWTFDLAVDRDGSVWASSADGLYSISSDRKTVMRYTHDPEDDTSLSDRSSRCLLVDSDGTFWAGTDNGLNRYNEELDTFKRFGLESGLPSTDIRSLAEDQSGRIWIGTGRGLARLDPDTNEIISFDRSDGFASHEFVERSVWLSDNGELVFGTEKGLVRFHPDKIELNDFIPDVLITRVSVFNEAVPISNRENAILRESPVVAKKIVLRPGQHSFSFEFVALNYIASEMNEFAYKLEGFDEDWVHNGKKRECSYTNISPGGYIFRVIASNNDGYWNEDGASLSVVLLPFFWETDWFKATMVFLIIAALVSIYALRVRNLSHQKLVLKDAVEDRTRNLRDALNELEQQKDYIAKQNEELSLHRERLEELIQRRTSQLETAKVKAEESERLKSAFLENMTHEIRTPMNAIVGFMSILKDKRVRSEDKVEFYDIVDQNCTSLLRLIDDIIDLSRMESEEAPLRTRLVNMNSMFRALESEYSEIITKGSASVRIKLDVDSSLPEPLVLEMDEERMVNVIRSMLDNALKFTDEGEIVFGFRGDKSETGEKRIEIFVKDTGMGISQEDMESIFDRFRKIESTGKKLYRGTGLGLAIVKKVTELMGGDIRVDSKVGEGTAIAISIPWLN